jgi:hypothetical protein
MRIRQSASESDCTPNAEQATSKCCGSDHHFPRDCESAVLRRKKTAVMVEPKLFSLSPHRNTALDFRKILGKEVGVCRQAIDSGRSRNVSL